MSPNQKSQEMLGESPSNMIFGADSLQVSLPKMLFLVAGAKSVADLDLSEALEARSRKHRATGLSSNDHSTICLIIPLNQSKWG